ncbi:unnamed protein product [Linum trigynum]|uniref:Uncharacterized protein n=1 Tax=Linum trigynum TaxID=586398 RepID=A0AAV2GDQ1_9ROSI
MQSLRNIIDQQRMRFLNLAILATHDGNKNYYGFSTEQLTTEILGDAHIRFGDEIANSNWNRATLTEQQIQYAALDALVSFTMGTKLKAYRWAYAYFYWPQLAPINRYVRYRD